MDKGVLANNPGGYLAKQKGCTCPVLDNAHGQGYYGNPDRFVINELCTLHGEEIINASINE